MSILCFDRVLDRFYYTDCQSSHTREFHPYLPTDPCRDTLSWKSPFTRIFISVHRIKSNYFHGYIHTTMETHQPYPFRRWPTTGI